MGVTMLNRRTVLAAAIGALAPLAAAPAFAQETKVTVQLPWLMNSGFAGEIIAAEMGFFEKRGLDVTLLPGGPGTNAVQELLGGTADIALAYAPQVMYSANRGLPLTSFAADFQIAPLTFYSLGETKIESVADWKGMRVGASQGAVPQIKAVLEYNGLSFDDITFVQAQVPALLQGQVDLVGSWPTNVTLIDPIVTHESGYNAQRIWDNGLQFQSNYHIVRKETLEGSKDMLVAYLEAVDEGWAYVIDNPEAAADALVAAVPALDRDGELAAIKIMAGEGFIYNDETVEHGFGNVSPTRWQETLDIYAKIGEISGDLTSADVLDTSILDAATRSHR